MANTYTALHYHVVFSTKNREPCITAEHEQRLWSYLGGIARENDMKPLMIGGIENHVHLLVGVSSRAKSPTCSRVKITHPLR